MFSEPAYPCVRLADPAIPSQGSLARSPPTSSVQYESQSQRDSTSVLPNRIFSACTQTNPASATCSCSKESLRIRSLSELHSPPYVLRTRFCNHGPRPTAATVLCRYEGYCPSLHEKQQLSPQLVERSFHGEEETRYCGTHHLVQFHKR